MHSKIIYVVIRDDGQYDDAHTRIIGVFDSKDKAQKIVNKIAKKIEKYRNEELYRTWTNNKNEAYEFNFCEIKEFELNK